MNLNDQVETIIVYPNRHYRAKNLALNDMCKGTYISLKALQAMMKVGVKFRFLREEKTYKDVTKETELKIYLHTPRKTANRAVSKEFDPYVKPSRVSD